MRGFRRVNYSQESYPFLIYKRISFLHSLEYANQKLEQGYNYLVKRITAKWDTRAAPLAPAFISPPLLIAMYTGGASISHQQLPVDFALITSPAGSGVFYDAAVSSRPMSAVARKMDKTINIPVLAYDVLQIEISGATIASNTVPELNHPSFCDVLVEGRYFPITD